MEHSLLVLIQRTCARLGLPQPEVALAATDETTKQLIQLVRDLGEEILSRHEWQRLKTRQTIAGAATVALQDDHDRFAGRAMVWDLTLDCPAQGPLDTKAWDEINVREIAASAPPYWSLIGNQINFYPTPSGNFTYTYVKNTWIIQDSDSSLVTDFESDDDTFVFPDRLLRAGLRYKWLETKGLDYAEPMSDFEREMERAISRDRGPRQIDTASRRAPPDNWWPGVITEA